MINTRFIPFALLSAVLAFPSMANDSAPATNETPAATEQKADKYEGIELKVNINTASADEIATMLKGVGSKKAQEVVKYREANGPFKAVEDLAKVKGIGQATVDKNRERIEL